MSSSGLTYKAFNFSKLRPGVLSLGVPIVDGAIQIGASSIEEKARLAVTVEPPKIRIAREDGEPLKIEEAVLAPERGGTVRQPVLARPIAEIVLHEGDSMGIWTIVDCPELRVYEPHAMESFVQLVAGHAVHKQTQDTFNR